jgi:hypothetical protein
LTSEKKEVEIFSEETCPISEEEKSSSRTMTRSGKAHAMAVVGRSADFNIPLHADSIFVEYSVREYVAGNSGLKTLQTAHLFATCNFMR